MRGFEAEKSKVVSVVSAIWIVIVAIGLAVLLFPIITFLAFSYKGLPPEFLYAILLIILFLYVLFSLFNNWSKRRRIREYQIWNNRIVIKDTDTEIPFEQIIDVEIGWGHGSKKRNGVWYRPDEGSEYCSYPILADDANYSGNAVFVYTTIKTNIPLLGKMNNYLVLTPMDREGFVKALKEELARYRARNKM